MGRKHDLRLPSSRPHHLAESPRSSVEMCPRDCTPSDIFNVLPDGPATVPGTHLVLNKRQGACGLHTLSPPPALPVNLPALSQNRGGSSVGGFCLHHLILGQPHLALSTKEFRCFHVSINTRTDKQNEVHPFTGIFIIQPQEGIKYGYTSRVSWMQPGRLPRSATGRQERPGT